MKEQIFLGMLVIVSGLVAYWRFTRPKGNTRRILVPKGKVHGRKHRRR